MSGTVVVSISGGKDSTASLLLALESGLDVVPVFLDTGWESVRVYEYLDYLERATGLSIVRTSAGTDMLSLIRKMRRFPSGRNRFCTRVLKREPFVKFLKESGAREVWIGLRRDESSFRSRMYHEETMSASDFYRTDGLDGVVVRFPILFWSKRDVFSFMRKHGTRPCKLYDDGFRRVGCFPCFLASKKDWLQTAKDPEGRENIMKLVSLQEELRSAGNDAAIIHDRFDVRSVLEESARRPPPSLFENDPCVYCVY